MTSKAKPTIKPAKLGDLKPSELATYQDLFERLLDCTFLLDPATNLILEVNPACERILGVPADKLVGRSILQWVDESMRDAFSKALRVSMRRYHPRQFDSMWRVDPDKTITMEVLACPLRLSGKHEALQVIARDVSFRRETEQKNQVLLRELQAANAKLEVLTTVDEMTGLSNYRHFRSLLIQEHTRAQRFSTPYSIVFCDLDHFKNYNDRNGHPAGDDLLREFARILQKCCRSSDLPARYGGEEFIVVCPGVSWEGAIVLGERIRTMVESAPLLHGETQPLGKVTVSVGLASYPADGDDADSIIKLADQALYYSKTNGRNQVTSAYKLKLLKKDAA